MHLNSKAWLRWAATLCTVLLLGLLVKNLRLYGFTLHEWLSENSSGRVLNHAEGQSKRIALTVDDGPDRVYTPKILTLLRRYGYHATFFPIGNRLKTAPECIQRILDDGHTIGNHSWSHGHLESMNAVDIRSELSKFDTALREFTDKKTYLVRLPRGYWNPIVFAEVAHKKSFIIDWSVSLEHNGLISANDMATRALDQIRPGSVLLMHEGTAHNRQASIDALGIILERLSQAGWDVVTVEDLFPKTRYAMP